ncbi:MAG: hypothetical protein Q8930_18120 [Bacillota bacterium]|nr:hypothetical protein [Bacillota bacterium]
MSEYMNINMGDQTSGTTSVMGKIQESDLIHSPGAGQENNTVSDITNEIVDDIKDSVSGSSTLSKTAIGTGAALLTAGVGYGLYRLGKGSVNAIKKLF